MPRGRQTNNTKDEQVKIPTQVQQDFALNEDFFKQYASALNSTSASLFFNPMYTNEILKAMNMTSQKYDRDTVKRLIANPQANEKQLKDLSQYLFNTIMQMKRLVIYMAEMLTYGYVLVPTNADEEDMQKSGFKNSYKKVTTFMLNCDPKTVFPDIIQSMLLEDGKFYYVRQNEYGEYWFQEMPTDYCKIWAKTDLGYQYAFNLNYFLKPGVNIDDYAPEFREYFNSFVNGDAYKEGKDNFKENRWFYWQTLDPSKAWVYKFDQLHAGLTPPMMGLFLDAIEITTYKDLLKSKTALDVYKLLSAKIPILDKENNKTGRRDNFAISPEIVGKYQAAIQAAIQQGIRVVASPFDLEPINLNNAENKDSIVGLANQEFWDTSGTSSILFSGNKLNAATMKASIKSDETFVTHLYRQVERFYNFKLREVSGKYRWKIKFEGTMFDKQERFDNALKAAQYGAPVSYLASAMDKPLHEFNSLLDFEKAIGIKNKFVPLMSSHVQSGKANGRPPKSDGELSDAGTETRDNMGNERDL